MYWIVISQFCCIGNVKKRDLASIVSVFQRVVVCMSNVLANVCGQ